MANTTGKKWGGRKKGTPNKMTVAAKEAIEQAFEGIGGVGALQIWASLNQGDFYTKVWPKILPLTLAGDKENPLEFIERAASHGREKLHRAASTAEAKRAK